MSDRQPNGQFSIGNAGGPGRKSRATERAYLAALGETINLDDWWKIVEKAKLDALAGDPKARDWLAKYLLGSQPMNLLDLAADEAAGIDEQEAIAIKAGKRAGVAALEKAFNGAYPAR